MQGGFEAAGDLITGGIVASAIEPGAGGPTAKGAQNCRNCGTIFVGNHCNHCGQSAHIHNTLLAFGHDLLHGVFHFDGKIWRTLPMLVFKPGELTRRYIDGERVRFVSPLALFLFSMFAMFAAFNSAGVGDTFDLKSQTVKDARVELKAYIAKANGKIATLERDRIAAQAVSNDVAEIDSDIAELKDEIKEAQGELSSLAKRGDSEGRYSESKNPIEINGNFSSSMPGLDSRISAGIKKANENPSLFVYKLQSAAYKYSWALIPLSLPFVWIVFAWRREFKLYDHIVFITYSLCFMSTLVILAALIGSLLSVGGEVTGLIVLAVPVHMYRQLRGTYRLGKRAAILRTAYLVIAALVTFILFIVLLLLLGLLG
jgi:hypothetical protein